MYQIPEFASTGVGSGASPVSFTDISSLGYDSGGQNQFMNYPSMTSSYPMPSASPTAFTSSPTSSYPPGIVPPATSSTPSSYYNPGTTVASKQGGYGLQGGAATGPSQDPSLTDEFNQWLQSQIGTGVTPFDLSAILPSTGQATAPGTLTAPENPLMQALQAFYLGQGGGVSGTMTPGGTPTGSPLSYVLPMWQSEVSAMNQPIQQQYADIKEQFGAQGALGSSEMAQAMANYGAQTAASEESLLGQLTLQALPQEQSMAQAVQSLDQESITNLYNEFIRTQPQYNPLIGNIETASTTYPPIYSKQGGVGSALIGSAGGILGGLASIVEANPGGIFGS